MRPKEWTIAIIDDEPDILDVVSLVIQDLGYKTRTAGDGLSGFELCKEITPQIVITDIRMPGMDGITLLKTLKQTFEDIEVIVVTAFGDFDLAIQALKADASDFITKPVDEKTLILAVNRAAERYTSRVKIKEYARFLELQNLSQAKILHRDKMISLGRLSASVVHEINNPMAGILNYARLMQKILKRDTPLHEKQNKFQRYLDLIETESSRISQIVSSLLTFSRKTEPQIRTIEARELLDSSITLSRHRLKTSNITLEKEIQPNLPPIQGDFTQIQQCLINLIFNAVDAMPEGGTITLSACLDTIDKEVCLKVKDTGIGIDSQHLQKIFEPFFTTKEEGHGTGLGLAILFGIMERHNGYVDVRSQTGDGASFTLRFPAVGPGQGMI